MRGGGEGTAVWPVRRSRGNSRNGSLSGPRGNARTDSQSGSRSGSRAARCWVGWGLAAFALLAFHPPAVWGQDAVAEVAPQLADIWASGQLRGLEEFFPDGGIHLSLQGVDHSGVNRRQARAALERFVEGFETRSMSARRAEARGGTPERGLVELIWTVRAAGTPEERSFVIFFSLERSSDDWCIREIRVFS